METKSFKDYLAQKKLKPATIKTYEKYLEHYLEWLKQSQSRAEDIQYTDLLDYLKECSNLGLKPGYINHLLTSVRHYYEYLKHLDKVKNNPAAGLFIKGKVRRLPHDLLSEKQLETIFETYKPKSKTGLSSLAFKRNKVILGLMIYQGLSTADLQKLEPLHLHLRKGKIEIPKTAKTNARTLKLEAHQLIDLQEYQSQIRPLILQLTGKSTSYLFTSLGESENLRNSIDKFLRQLKKQHSFLKEIKQLRQSRIALWTKQYDIRQAQYLAGHKYVSSTERYEKTNLEDLKKQLYKHHPLK